MYNREAALEYAKIWALRRNPKYYNFDNIGGNCTNFISQCLYAGGSVMNFTKDTGWYYINQNNRAAAWTSVSNLHRFLTTNKSHGPKGKVIPLHKIKVADIIQLSFKDGIFSHSLFVTEVWPIILVAANSDDVLDKPLHNYEYKEARGITIIS